MAASRISGSGPKPAAASVRWRTVRWSLPIALSHAIPNYIDRMENTYFRKGFGLKNEIAGRLNADYHSSVVEVVRANEHRLVVGALTFRLAREFGFCYGVDRAVEYAYETRTKFPDRRIFLVGEIIHNPHVNAKLSAMGIVIIERSEGGEFDFATVTAEDVVILPAFGVTKDD